MVTLKLASLRPAMREAISNPTQLQRPYESQCRRGSKHLARAQLRQASLQRRGFSRPQSRVVASPQSGTNLLDDLNRHRGE
jgi:hypothetical protein